MRGWYEEEEEEEERGRAREREREKERKLDKLDYIYLSIRRFLSVITTSNRKRHLSIEWKQKNPEICLCELPID